MNAEELAFSTVYTEEQTPMHTEITAHQFQSFLDIAKPQPGETILDFGCGMGVAWPYMRAAGLPIKAITPNLEEATLARDSGIHSFYSLSAMEQYYNSGYRGECKFNHIWSRHSLEHVINPFETLLAFKRLLHSGGCVYIEVPAPDTACEHENNPNHYSVLGDRMWKSLFEKAGLSLYCFGHLDLGTIAGPDKYFWYILKKA